jgi:hypothetical protein
MVAAGRVLAARLASGSRGCALARLGAGGNAWPEVRRHAGMVERGGRARSGERDANRHLDAYVAGTAGLGAEERWRSTAATVGTQPRPSVRARRREAQSPFVCDAKENDGE